MSEREHESIPPILLTRRQLIVGGVALAFPGTASGIVAAYAIVGHRLSDTQPSTEDDLSLSERKELQDMLTSEREANEAALNMAANINSTIENGGAVPVNVINGLIRDHRDPYSDAKECVRPFLLWSPTGHGTSSLSAPSDFMKGKYIGYQVTGFDGKVAVKVVPFDEGAMEFTPFTPDRQRQTQMVWARAFPTEEGGKEPVMYAAFEVESLLSNVPMGEPLATLKGIQ